MSERERFERWAQTQQWSLDRCPRYGHYLVSHIEWQWQAWQARADLAAERERELEIALGECIAVMKRSIYPKPDVSDDHPWAILRRASQVYYQDSPRSGGKEN